MTQSQYHTPILCGQIPISWRGGAFVSILLCNLHAYTDPIENISQAMELHIRLHSMCTTNAPFRYGLQQHQIQATQYSLMADSTFPQAKHSALTPRGHGVAGFGQEQVANSILIGHLLVKQVTVMDDWPAMDL